MRRIRLRTLGMVALAASLAASVAACQSDGGGGGGGDGDCGGKIAIFGAFSGPNSGLVIPSLNGAKLAVKQHNEANPDCPIEMQEFDTQGAPDQASPVASQIVGDPTFLGVIGGHFSGETDATIPVFQGAGVAMVAPSATRVDLTGRPGVTVFHRVVGNDNTQGAAVAAYLRAQNAEKVFIIDDSSAYGAGIADELASRLQGGPAVERDKVQEQQTQFDATISKLQTFQPTHIFYGGYTREAAPLIRQIRQNNINAQFIGPDGLYDPQFATGASGAAEGAIITCPCLPASEAGGTFSQDFQAEYGVAPGSYGAEGFDAAQVFIDVIAGGATTREEVLAGVKAYSKQGVSKYIEFDEGGDVDPSRVVIWSYQVKGDTFEPLQELTLN